MRYFQVLLHTFRGSIYTHFDVFCNLFAAGFTELQALYWSYPFRQSCCKWSLPSARVMQHLYEIYLSWHSVIRACIPYCTMFRSLLIELAFGLKCIYACIFWNNDFQFWRSYLQLVSSSVIWFWIFSPCISVRYNQTYHSLLIQHVLHISHLHISCYYYYYYCYYLLIFFY